MLAPERVAAAEYAKRRVLADTVETRFGTFVHDSAHDDRAAATQLLDARLPPAGAPPTDSAVDEPVQHLRNRIDALYAQRDLTHRVIAGVDDGTAARLAPILSERGYERENYRALVAKLVDSDSRPAAVDIESDSHGSNDARLVHESVGRDREGIAYAAAVAGALAGQEVVAYRDGDPVGAAGWYIHEGDGSAVARLTHIGVRPEAQGEGVGSTLVRAVVNCCPLPASRIVVCATPEHVGFYEQLGFVRNNTLWRFARLP